MQLDDLKQWAYRTLADPEPKPVRVEVGSALLEALKATAPPRDDSEADPSALPRFPYSTLLGVPLAENEELAPMGWCTYDRWGRQIAGGVGL